MISGVLEVQGVSDLQAHIDNEDVGKHMKVYLEEKIKGTPFIDGAHLKLSDEDQDYKCFQFIITVDKANSKTACSTLKDLSAYITPVNDDEEVSTDIATLCLLSRISYSFFFSF